MSEQTPDPCQEDIVIPALLRAARNSYGRAIRAALAEAGYDDVPRNGIYVIGALARGAGSLGEIIPALGVSKQAAGQLVDTLVLRGYLNRRVDAEDRRRLSVTLTERGQATAAVSRAAVERVDAHLAQAVPAEYVAHMRQALRAIIDYGQDSDPEINLG